MRGIARTFRVSEDALSRHVKGGHVIAKIKQAAKAQEVAEADDLLKEVQETEKITRTLIARAFNRTTKNGAGVDVPNPDYDPRIALQGLARREKQIELKGRVLGSFKDPQGKGNNPTIPPVNVNLNLSEEVKKYAHLLSNVANPK
ncbi:MAG: hypothetical protein WC455_29130 [Dehalococcoidia bacterium]